VTFDATLENRLCPRKKELKRKGEERKEKKRRQIN
jgi:hypothetical protein